MADSYSHVTTDNGRLRDPESFSDMIENLGDAYEAVEEMYGMIWSLVAGYGDGAPEVIERARQNYREGLEVARRVLGDA